MGQKKANPGDKAIGWKKERGKQTSTRIHTAEINGLEKPDSRCNEQEDTEGGGGKVRVSDGETFLRGWRINL